MLDLLIFNAVLGLVAAAIANRKGQPFVHVVSLRPDHLARGDHSRARREARRPARRHALAEDAVRGRVRAARPAATGADVGVAVVHAARDPRRAAPLVRPALTEQ
jgi:hypothetical protein